MDRQILSHKAERVYRQQRINRQTERMANKLVVVVERTKTKRVSLIRSTWRWQDINYSSARRRAQLTYNRVERLGRPQQKCDRSEHRCPQRQSSHLPATVIKDIDYPHGRS